MTSRLFLFLLPYFFTGLAVSLVAIFLEKFMINIGLTPGHTATTASFAFITTTLFQLIKFPQPLSFDWYILAGLFLGLLGANRYDLSHTIQKGRWWWKSK